MNPTCITRSLSSGWRARAPFTLLLLLSVSLTSPLIYANSGEDRDDDDHGDNKKNIVYVQTNDYTANKNAVIGYQSSNSNGCLQEIGRFPTGGTGVRNPDDRIGPDDHAQEVVVDRENRRLLTVNGGSDSIAVFNIRDNGKLTPVSGSPFASNGIQPVSIGLAEHGIVYVVNQAGDPQRLPTTAHPNYTGFRTQKDGRLAAIPNSTFNLPLSSFPSQALTRPKDSILFGDPFLGTPFMPPSGFPSFLPPAGSFLDSFQIDSNGRLKETSGSPVAPGPNAQVLPEVFNSRYVLGMWLHPRLNILYATYVVTNRLAVYTYDNSGNLHFVNDIPIGNGAGDPNAVTVCWVVVSPDGKFIYTSDAGSNAISVFDISGTIKPASSAMSPVLIQVFPMRIPAGPGGVTPGSPIPTVFNSPTVSFQLDTDPDGNFLYVVGHELVLDNTYPQGNVVHSLKVNKKNGTLSEAGCSPVNIGGIPAGAHPQGVAVIRASDDDRD